MKTAVAYIRVSSEEQTAGTSLETQRAACLACAARFGLPTPTVFEDAGISAKSTAGRAGLAAAVALARKSKAAFVVYKWDRLARNVSDALQIREALRACGCRVISASEGEAEETPLSRAMFGIAAIFAQLDNEMRGERARGGMAARAKAGFWVSNPPAGYLAAHDGGRALVLRPDPAKAPAIVQAFEGLAAGTLSTAAAIRSLMLALRMSRARATALLHAPIYKGVINSALTDWRDVPAAFPGIVPAVVWDAAQLKFTRPKGYITMKNRPEFPLSKIAVCSVCGKPLRHGFTTGRDGSKRGYYFCACSGHASISAEKAHAAVREMLSELSACGDYLKLIRANLHRLTLADDKEEAKALKAWKAKAAAAESRLERARAAFLDGVFTREEYESERAKQTAIVQEARVFERTNREMAARRDRAIDACIQLFADAGGLWDSLDPDALADLLRVCFNGFSVAKGGKIEPRQDSIYETLVRGSRGEKTNGAPFVALVDTAGEELVRINSSRCRCG